MRMRPSWAWRMRSRAASFSAGVRLAHFSLTAALTNGLAFGFVSYAVLKLLTGRAREVHAATWIVAGLFVIRFAFFPEG